ncbi:MAG: hypothetical protein U0840_08665 [Gemmataceae bacterium]
MRRLDRCSEEGQELIRSGKHILPQANFDSKVLNDPDVLKLAQMAYKTNDRSILPHLGDALEDAGCSNHWALKHCHQPPASWHWSDCWVLDGLLAIYECLLKDCDRETLIEFSDNSTSAAKAAYYVITTNNCFLWYSWRWDGQNKGTNKWFGPQRYLPCNHHPNCRCSMLVTANRPWYSTGGVDLQLTRPALAQILTQVLAKGTLHCSGLLLGAIQTDASPARKATQYHPFPNSLLESEPNRVDPDLLLDTLQKIQSNDLAVMAFFRFVGEGEAFPLSIDLDWDPLPSRLLAVMSFKDQEPHLRIWTRNNGLFNESSLEITGE